MTTFIRLIWSIPVVTCALLASAGCGDSEATPAPEGSAGSGGAPGAGGTGVGGTPTSCTTSGNCAAPTPYCETGICVECSGDANCSNFGNRNACNIATHRCVECAADADCGGGSYCDTGAGRCVDCMTDANCNDAALGCDVHTHSCVSKCTTNGVCADPRPYCDTGRGLCVECQGDANCGSQGGQVCDMTTFRCVDCNSDTDCGGGNPYCTPTHQCVECLTDANCNGRQCQRGNCN